MNGCLGAALLGLVLLGGEARACITPVFRYALERWEPSSYPLYVFHRGPLTTGDQTILGPLRQISETQRLANVTVLAVDVNAPLPKGVEPIWKAQTNASLPWMVLRYPDAEPEAPSAWAGPLTRDNARQLVDSPLRRAVAQGIAGGQSAVWVLLESGDQAQDDKAAALLATELKKAARVIELPPDPALDQTNGVALKVSFSLIRSPRNAPQEALFTHMLLSVDEELASLKTPVAVPIFGRGRALCALPGEQILPEVLKEAIAFMTGACSCEVKEMNPGLDLLMTADWDAAVAGKRLSDHPPPALMGLGGLVEKTDPTTNRTGKTSVVADVSVPPASGNWYRGLIWFGIGLVGVLVLATLFVVRGRR
jgi:hypothetical protein